MPDLSILKPTWKSGDVELYLGDCLDILPQLPAGSVDAILTDIPYGTTACSWDEIIPFEPMWREVKRVLKPRGVFATTASQPFTSKLVISNLDWFKYEWIWDKDQGGNFFNVNKAPLKTHENILVFSKNGHEYHPIMTKAMRKNIRPLINGSRSNISGIAIRHSDNANNNKRYPKTIIKYSRNNAECNLSIRVHPTQKPVFLYEYLTLTYTNVGETILDLAMGSGTTGVACVQTGRKFIGIEIDEGYFDIAVKRIKEAQMQLRFEI
jgi:site-specific DNA-methyltransferase (adenine-specific)